MNDVALRSQSLYGCPNLASIRAVDILASSPNHQNSVTQELILPPSIENNYSTGCNRNSQHPSVVKPDCMEKPGGVGLATKHHWLSFILDVRKILWCLDQCVVFDGKALVSKKK